MDKLANSWVSRSCFHSSIILSNYTNEFVIFDHTSGRVIMMAEFNLSNMSRENLLCASLFLPNNTSLLSTIVAAIVKIRGGKKFFYNFYVQESGKVKGLAVVTPAEIKIWYGASQVKLRQFGL